MGEKGHSQLRAAMSYAPIPVVRPAALKLQESTEAVEKRFM
jgi:hypothetical protein